MADALPVTTISATGLTGAEPHDARAQYFKYPDNLGSPPFDKWIFFEAKSGRHVMRNTVVSEQNGKDRTLSAVGLYLSETAVRSSLTVAYEDTALGPMWGAAVEALAQSGKNVTDAIFAPGVTLSSLLEAIKDSGSNVAGKVLGLGESFKTGIATDLFSLGAGLIDQLGALGPGQGGGAGALGTAFGMKPNPRTDILFDTQSFRTYDMNFTLIPRTLAEAQQIDRILSFFQFYMLPKYMEQPANGGIGSFMLGFPYEFEISLRDSDNNRLEHLNKFERCVLKNITIDHASAGKTAFIKDGKEFYPVASTLQLSFQEVRLLDRRSDAITRNPPGTVYTPTNLPDPRI